MRYKISVVIPLYNQGINIKHCITTLKKQSYKFNNMEIILINDGSSDQSGMICEKLAARYSNIIYITQENRGVSSARNQGIRHATGKYIFFLDADDTLEKHTIKNVVDFFDSVYDEVDLVTYPIETIYKGRIVMSHFRYLFLKEDGVYDLNEYAYIGQTTMNIVVKNRFDQNVLFDENQTFSEDQKYCCDVLSRTLKMGFCKQGKYIYYRSDNSSSGKLSGACYIFEQCMAFFEELFSKYDDVPLAFQGLYANDIYWKMLSNILFPYHYEGAEYENAIGRIRSLLQKCDNEVILYHPRMNFFEKFYLLHLKSPESLQYEITPYFFGLKNKDTFVKKENNIEIVVTKFRINGDRLELLAFVKSVFLQFYDKDITVCAVENDGILTRKLKIFPSAHCHYMSREKTQKFWAFRYEASLSEVHKVKFEVGFGSCWFPTHFYFMPRIPFSHQHGRYHVIYQGYEIDCTKKNEFCFCKAEEYHKKNIWLYYDCVDVECDNGYLQFEHDIQKHDGIERYYIVTDDRQKKDRRYDEYYVPFGSKKHKWLLNNCDKILTAYIEESNVYPFSQDEIKENADKMDFQVIYLQHGVLHIVMPWKFSPEKIMADKVVVSTHEEKELYLKNGFSEEELICSGMPRFDLMTPGEEKKKKILMAMSWRSYLVGNYDHHRWTKLDDKFMASAYFTEFQKFVNNPELHRLLKESGYQLDIRLHPIFSTYQSMLEAECDNITFVPGEIQKEEYEILITDFSSFLYDFLYLGADIINFIPDITEFKCGMNGYRDLNYGEDFWNHVVYTADDLVEKVKNYLGGNKDQVLYCNFFEMTECRENIYKNII